MNQEILTVITHMCYKNCYVQININNHLKHYLKNKTFHFITNVGQLLTVVLD